MISLQGYPGEGRGQGGEGMGAFPLPVCQDDDGAGAGEGTGAYLLPGGQGEGGGRGGGGGQQDIRLDLVCEDAGLNPPESSSLISEQGSGTTVPDSPFSDRGCCCRGRGCRRCRG